MRREGALARVKPGGTAGTTTYPVPADKLLRQVFLCRYAGINKAKAEYPASGGNRVPAKSNQ